MDLNATVNIIFYFFGTGRLGSSFKKIKIFLVAGKHQPMYPEKFMTIVIGMTMVLLIMFTCIYLCKCETIFSDNKFD